MNNRKEKGSFAVTLIVVIGIIIVAGIGIYFLVNENKDKSNTNNQFGQENYENKVNVDKEQTNNEVEYSNLDNNTSNDVKSETVSNNTKVNENSNAYSIEAVISSSSSDRSYNFKEKRWLPNDSAEYYIAIDSNGKLCIVQPIQGFIQKTDILLSTLVTSAYTNYNDKLIVVQKNGVAYEINVTNFEYRKYIEGDGAQDSGEQTINDKKEYINEYSIEKVIVTSPDSSYNFKEKTWLSNNSAKYYIAKSNDGKLCIVNPILEFTQKTDVLLNDLVSSAYINSDKKLVIIQKNGVAYEINVTNFEYRKYTEGDGMSK